MTTKLRTKHYRQTHPKCGKSVTEQHHAKTCNINYIVGKYQKTGLVDHINKHEGSYGDVSNADFETAMSLVTEQTTVFNELPSSVRKHYKNDVQTYLEALGTEEGQNEHRALLNPVVEQETAPEEPQEPEKVPEPEPEPVT